MAPSTSAARRALDRNPASRRGVVADHGHRTPPVFPRPVMGAARSRKGKSSLARRGRLGRGMLGARRCREVHLVQPHAVAVPARRFPRVVALGLGRHPQHAVRPGPRQRRVPRLHGPARVRRRARLRRDRRQRTPPERLRHHAEPQPHRRRAGPPHQQRGDLRHRQLDRPLQPADPGRRGVRHARLHQRWPPRRRLPRRHADGHELLLRADPGPDARQVRRGARPHHAGVGGRRAVRLRRQVQPAALRQLLAEADPAAASADLHPGRRLRRDVGLLPRPRLQLLVPLLRRVPRTPSS